jgi:hypothetical protein
MCSYRDMSCQYLGAYTKQDSVSAEGMVCKLTLNNEQGSDHAVSAQASHAVSRFVELILKKHKKIRLLTKKL